LEQAGVKARTEAEAIRQASIFMMPNTYTDAGMASRFNLASGVRGRLGLWVQVF
jgi:hypothetical protein